MGDTRPRRDAGDLKLHRLNACLLKQADALTQQDWYQINPDFFQQTSLQRLPRDICAADTDIFITGDFLRPGNSGFDPTSVTKVNGEPS